MNEYLERQPKARKIEGFSEKANIRRINDGSGVQVSKPRVAV